MLIVGGIGGSGGSASDVSIQIVLNRALSVVGAILRATPPVRDQVAVITGGCNVFVFGGTTDNVGANASDMALYNYNTTYYPDFFVQFPPMPSPRSQHGVVNIVGNRFLIVYGLTDAAAPLFAPSHFLFHF